ncbi:MAG: hypothetical protein EAZ31_00060 [Cytophagia bacterium]|nr:MAG: hypothetical protein EAZ31_00060 [Cytophagia bacterium]
MEKQLSTVFEGETYQILMDYDSSMMILHWFDSTNDWTDEDFKQENLNIVRVVAHYKPTYLLSLSQEFRHIITPDEQLWLVDNVFKPHYENGVRKMAILMSRDFVPQVSLEQLIDETSMIPNGIFTTEEEARTWLLS